MSEFDQLATANATELVAVMGDAAAVELLAKNGPHLRPAIVGRLRVEAVETLHGNTTHVEHREVCTVQIRCERSEVWIGQYVLVARYTTGDASTHEGQKFTVRQITNAGVGLVAVELDRAYVADVQRRGFAGSR